VRDTKSEGILEYREKVLRSRVEGDGWDGAALYRDIRETWERE
jgi:hypothetical protein